MNFARFARYVVCMYYCSLEVVMKKSRNRQLDTEKPRTLQEYGTCCLLMNELNLRDGMKHHQSCNHR